MKKIADYAYFVLCLPGQKGRTAFIRMKHESVDAEWKEMCSDRLRTYPCEVFHRDQPGMVPDYEHVTLSWLKKVDEATAVEVESEWNSRNDVQTYPTAAKSEPPRLRF